LALPFSFKKIGVILGTILFLAASASVYWTLKLLIKVAYKENNFSYSFLLNKYYGQNQVFLYELMNLIANFGGMIVYQQISNFTNKFKISFKLLFRVFKLL
jgi:amino acid permease